MAGSTCGVWCHSAPVLPGPAWLGCSITRVQDNLRHSTRPMGLEASVASPPGTALTPQCMPRCPVSASGTALLPVQAPLRSRGSSSSRLPLCASCLCPSRLTVCPPFSIQRAHSALATLTPSYLRLAPAGGQSACGLLLAARWGSTLAPGVPVLSVRLGARRSGGGDSHRGNDSRRSVLHITAESRAVPT
jgi:hypothetical protein